ncbi:MAG TPA: bifunctional DNA primase/polymerase, partial [Ktedonobacterales bacterium]|nr:bifunctional DNA primase/polymerase [Ktedonobacterales bacterium]
MGTAVNKEEGMLEAARAYTRRGWRVVPVRPGEKSVAIVRWPEMRLDEDDLPKWFRGAADTNIGILTGEPSGGLVDVDCDAPEAREAAAALLPDTGRMSGRA